MNVIFETSSQVVSDCMSMKDLIFKDVNFALIKDGCDWYRIIISNSDSKQEFRFNAREDKYKMILSDSNCKFDLTIMSGNDVVINISVETNSFEVMKCAEFIFEYIFIEKNKTQNKSKEIGRDLAPIAVIPTSSELLFITTGLNFEKIFKTGNGEVSEKLDQGVFRLHKLSDCYKISIESCWKNMHLKFDGSSYTHVFTSNKEIFHIFFTFDTRRIVLRGTFEDNETVSKLKRVMSQIKAPVKPPVPSTAIPTHPPATRNVTVSSELNCVMSQIKAPVKPSSPLTAIPTYPPAIPIYPPIIPTHPLATTNVTASRTKPTWNNRTKRKNPIKKLNIFIPSNKVSKLNNNRFSMNSVSRRFARGH